MIVVVLPPKRIDRRAGEPFDNAAQALKAAFDIGLAPVDLSQQYSLQLLRRVARTVDRPAPTIAA